MVDAQDAGAGSDIAVLRRELAVRIVLQNLLLISNLFVFAAFAILSLARPQFAWLSAASQGSAGLSVALQWCHHGIRTKQIKMFLMTLDCEESQKWERWLPLNRPNTILGSRWFVSTKGSFVGLQLAMIIVAWSVSPVANPAFALVATVLLVASTWFLLTNPKE